MQPKNSEIIVKSNLFNALFLEFIKQFILNLVFFLPLFIIYLLLEYVFKIEFRNIAILSLIGITVLFSFYRISSGLINILLTKYIFTPYTVEKRHGLFTTTSHSLSYSQITDIELNMSFWDKICNVGNLIIHTANDSHSENKKIKASMILKDIKNPLKLKHELMLKVNSKSLHQNHQQTNFNSQQNY